MHPFLTHPTHKGFVTILSVIIFACCLNALTTQSVLAQASVGASPTIIGGEEVTDNIYPWTVALIKDGSTSVESRQFCGGTLISSQWIVTAAHCTFRGTTPRTVESISVLIGTTSLNFDENQQPAIGTSALPPNGQLVAITKIVRHPSYERATANADIALLRLAKPVSYPTIEIGDSALLSPAQKAQTMVLGWGRTEEASRSRTLRQVDVPLVDWETCRSTYASFSYSVNENMICAGYDLGGKDACTGDSGGPLVAPKEYNVNGTARSWSLIGVVSWGRGCAEKDAYGVYANIGSAAAWIASTLSSVDMNPETELIGGVSTNLSFVFLPLIQ